MYKSPRKYGINLPSPDDEKDARSSQEYMDDLEEEYQARALLAKSKRFFKKGTQRFSGAKATDQTECHKCGRKSFEHKPELKHNKDFEARYNKVKAMLALLSSSASASNSSLGKNKGLIAKTYEWDEEEVSSDENERIEVKALMALTDEERAKRHGIVKSSANNSNVSITISNKTRLYEAKDSTLPNHDTGKVPPDESQRNMTNPSVTVSNSSATDYDSTDESLVCSTPLPPLEKLAGAKPVSGPKTIKSILK
ncbi:hypothetical protein Tco_0953759 [Tanacetum coccineum]|uniref:Uncharacterized protein n=1 Tax=Tanacetum coccineum TaxID=301880 RepID=A0ABQ5E459_9ASTR